MGLSIRYRARRPFHGERLRKWMAQDWPGVLRSKGFFGWQRVWTLLVSGRVRVCSQMLAPQGVGLPLVPQAHWPDDPDEIKLVRSNWVETHGDRRQEIVVIGFAQQMDVDFITQCF